MDDGRGGLLLPNLSRCVFRGSLKGAALKTGDKGPPPEDPNVPRIIRERRHGHETVADRAEAAGWRSVTCSLVFAAPTPMFNQALRTLLASFCCRSRTQGA